MHRLLFPVPVLSSMSKERTNETRVVAMKVSSSEQLWCVAGCRGWIHNRGTSGASAISFDLTSDHCTGGCGTAPFGTVDVTRGRCERQYRGGPGQWATQHRCWASTGAADFQLFKLNATGVAVGDISVTQTFAGQTLQANTGTFNGDGTGPFTFESSCTTCGNGATSALRATFSSLSPMRQSLTVTAETP